MNAIRKKCPVCGSNSLVIGEVRADNLHIPILDRVVELDLRAGSVQSTVKCLVCNYRTERQQLEEEDGVSHWLLVIHGDVEPELQGPFTDSAAVEGAALLHRLDDPNGDDGLYPVKLDGRKLQVDAFSSGFMAQDLNREAVTKSLEKKVQHA